ncbi:evasin-3-like [Rhipicephalus microplus]|uniref:evasin-3-like n=1 Tax=Rhipicephalus microplus TaxID=6941 RepID=UPI003F6A9579
MALFKAFRHLLFLLVALEAMRARPNALVLSVEAMTYEDDKYNINVVSCNKTCTSGGDDCPLGCFCGLLGYNTTGHCYMITGNFPEYEPVVLL